MIRLFQGIDDKNKEKLLYSLETHSFTFPCNTSILNIIQDDTIIGFVETGYLQILYHDYNGTTTILEELEENDVFGTNISILNTLEYDIRTMEESKILIINYDSIFSCESKTFYYQQFLCNLIQIMTEKMKEKNERVSILSKRSIRDKLLEYFRIVSKKNGSKIIYLPYHYIDLASYLAVDRSAMARELKYLKEEGFIKVENKKITLLY